MPTRLLGRYLSYLEGPGVVVGHLEVADHLLAGGRQAVGVTGLHAQRVDHLLKVGDLR